MKLDFVVPPSVEPVTLEQVWAQLRITPTGSPPSSPRDETLEMHITTARIEAESDTGRVFVPQTLRLTGHTYRTGHWDSHIDLLRPPIISIESVSYYDSNNELVEFDEAEYFATTDGQLRFTTGFAYPTLYDRPDAFSIEYRAGYDSTESPPDYRAAVPSPIRAAILIGVELLESGLTSQERESLECTRARLLSRYVVHVVA